MDLNGGLSVSPRESARPRRRRMVARAPLLAAAVFAFAASARAGSLHDVVAEGDAAAVTRILDAGADPNARRERGYTPLHLAARRGCVDLARLLLDRGADPNARREDGFTPLHMAAGRGRIGLVRLLLERGADLEAAWPGRTLPLHWAAGGGGPHRGRAPAARPRGRPRSA